MPLEHKPLPFPSDALEPHIDKQTMEIHHGRHYKAYVDNYNKAVSEKQPDLDGKPLHEVLAGNLAMVKDGMTRVLPMAEFNPGHRYADFKPGSDKLAAYGLAALVGGGIAAKAGLFAKLGVFLLAFKKIILVGVVALGALLKKIFGGKDKREDGTVS